MFLVYVQCEDFAIDYTDFLLLLGFNRAKGELRERYKVLASMRGGQSPQVR